MLEPIWLLAAWLGVTLRLYLGIPWMRLNAWIGRPLFRISKRPMHSVLVVGDGFAEGAGDWTTLGSLSGLAAHLANAMSRSARVRHRWEVSCIGQWRSTTRDWRPDAAQPAASFASLSCRETKPLMIKTLTSAEYQSSAAVVVLAGSMDGARAARLAPPLTGQNMEAMIRALTTGIATSRSGTMLVNAHRDAPSSDETEEEPADGVAGGHRARPRSSAAKGASVAGPSSDGDIPSAYEGFTRPVIVVTLPANAPQALERNARIRAAVARLQMEFLPIALCDYPELTQAMVCFDSMHPSSTGYENLASTVLPLLEPLIMRVEAAMASVPVAERCWWHDSESATAAMRKLAHHPTSSSSSGDRALGSEVSPSIGRRSAWLTTDESIPEIRADVSAAGSLKGAMAMLLE